MIWGEIMFERSGWRYMVPENHRLAVGEGDLWEDLIWAFLAGEHGLNCLVYGNRGNRGMLRLRGRSHHEKTEDVRNRRRMRRMVAVLPQPSPVQGLRWKGGPVKKEGDRYRRLRTATSSNPAARASLYG